MENAVDAVKRVARVVTASNDDDGVAKVLDSLRGGLW
jgi:hydroxymethylpyrimidine pyrophosphatase-like HAD family hydrolase